MDLVFYILIILVIMASVATLIYLVLYNKIQRYKIKIDEAEAIIDDVLRLRFDLLSRLYGFIDDEKDQKYFKDFESLRIQKISNFDLDRKITEGIIVFERIKNDNKDLLDNKDIKNIEGDFKVSEEKLEAAKEYFNKHTSSLNALIKTFPSLIIAKMHNIKIKPYYDGKDLTDDDINDFKL